MPDQTKPDLTPPKPGLVITELMIMPKTAAAPAGEWFEIYNSGTTNINLHGYTFADAPGTGQQKFLLKSSSGKIILVPGKRVQVGVEQIKSKNGSVPVDIRIATKWTLDDTSDEIYIYDASNKLVDKVEWDSSKGWTITSGATLSLKDAKLDNNKATSWCTESKLWCGTCDKGTPSKPPACK